MVASLLVFFLIIQNLKCNPLPHVNQNTNFRFAHKNPEDNDVVPGGFLSDCVQDSLIVKEAFADESLRKCEVYDRFQFERIGYFSVDPDTTDHLVSCSFPLITSCWPGIKHRKRVF